MNVDVVSVRSTIRVSDITYPASTSTPTESPGYCRRDAVTWDRLSTLGPYGYLTGLEPMDLVHVDKGMITWKEKSEISQEYSVIYECVITWKK